MADSVVKAKSEGHSIANLGAAIAPRHVRTPNKTVASGSDLWPQSATRSRFGWAFLGAHGFHAQIGQLIGPLVTRMAIVAAHPAPFHFMDGLGRIEGLPQVDAFHRCLGRRFPAARLPAVDPFADALLHVLAIG